MALPTGVESTPAADSFARGRYQLRRLHRESGRKRIHLARDTRLERNVILETIDTGGLTADVLAQISGKAQAVAQLGDHPHIVTIYDIGVEEQCFYLICRQMLGGDLAELLKRSPGNRLTLDHALRLADQISLGLHHAHSEAVVHGDLRPEAIWLSEDGTVQLGEFDLLGPAEPTRLSRAGTLAASVPYLSPEEVLGEPPDARSDLYALGTILYELLAGRPPFVGDNTDVILSQHTNSVPRPPSLYTADLPPALDNLVLRLLAKNPEDRPPNVEALCNDLSTITSAPTEQLDRAEHAPIENPAHLAEGVFVGRHKQMENLRAALQKSLRGRGRMFLLSGEAGIGKTRVAEELAAHARLHGVRVARVCCRVGIEAGYAPWARMIRACADTLGNDLDEDTAILLGLLPPPPKHPSPPAARLASVRAGLVSSIATVLRKLADRQPLLIVADDLQWADPASLALLRPIASQIASARILFLGVYRDTGLDHGHPLAELAGDLRTSDSPSSFSLPPLGQREVAELIKLGTGKVPAAALVATVHKQAKGNPGFITELLRSRRLTEGSESASDDRHVIPDTIRDLIENRLAGLPPQARAALSIAAVVGNPFDRGMLEKVSTSYDEIPLGGDRLLHLMRTAVAARLIDEVPGSSDHYTFAHDLIREVLYNDLNRNDRARLHTQLAHVLMQQETVDPRLSLAEITYHAWRAAENGQQLQEAITFARQAGDSAVARGTYEDAAYYYGKALRTVDLSTPDHLGTTEETRCSLLLSRAQALRLAGEQSAAREDFREAAHHARDLCAGQRPAEAAAWLAQATLALARETVEATEPDAELVPLLRQALAALPDGDPLRAPTLARLAQELATVDRDEADSLSQQAVAIARSHADPQSLAEAADRRHMVLDQPQFIRERLDLAQEILDASEACDSDAFRLRGLRWLTVDLLEAGRIDDALDRMEAYRQIVESSQAGGHLYYSALFRGLDALVRGHLEEVEAQAQEAVLLGREGGIADALQSFGMVMLLTRREQGRLDEMGPTVQNFTERFPDIAVWRCAGTFVRAELEDTQGARENFEKLAAADFSDLPHDASWLAAIGMLAETCAFLADEHRASILYSLLEPFADHCPVLGPGAAALGPLGRHLGLLAATMKQRARATRHLAKALALTEHSEAHPWLARILHDYAAVLLDGAEEGDRRHALRLLDRTLAITSVTGMRHLQERASALGLRARAIETPRGKASLEALVTAALQKKAEIGRYSSAQGRVAIALIDIQPARNLDTQQAQELQLTCDALIRLHARKFNGSLVVSRENGYLLAFSELVQSMRCAVAIQRDVAAYVQQDPDMANPIRIGIHAGTNDFFRDNVLVAARVTAHANGGGVYISSELRRLGGRSRELKFGDGERVKLPGTHGTHLLYRLEWSKSPDSTRPAIEPGDPERSATTATTGPGSTTHTAAPVKAPILRQPVAILVTTMEDAASFARRLGAASANALRHEYDKAVRLCTSHHDGRELRRDETGFLVIFPSAWGAVQCAVEIQQALATLEREQPDNPIRTRIALDIAEAIAEEDQVFGATVRRTESVCAKTRPGRILASEGIRQLASNRDVFFTGHGQSDGNQSVSLYEVRWHDRGRPE